MPDNPPVQMSISDIVQELRDYPAVDVTTVVFSRDFAGVGCCVIPQDRVLAIIGALTAALSGQVMVPKDEYASLMKREHAEAQVILLARALGEVTKKLGIAAAENRKLLRQNKKQQRALLAQLPASPGKGVES